jgi:hypothetical protein
MPDIPILLTILFILTTLVTVYFLYKAAHRSRQVLLVISIWMIAQAAIAISGFYTVTNVMPPRFMLTMLPAILFIIGMFISKKGRAFIDSLDLKTLTLLHTVRIAVELILFWLFLKKAVPLIMTFEGKNIDILAGITAPIIYYLVFVRKSVGRIGLLVWNIFGLASLFNIVTIAVLSAPFPIQRLALDQPNIAVLYFPFNWLPSVIVTIVLFSHLAAIRKLLVHANL